MGRLGLAGTIPSGVGVVADLKAGVAGGLGAAGCSGHKTPRLGRVLVAVLPVQRGARSSLARRGRVLDSNLGYARWPDSALLAVHLRAPGSAPRPCLLSCIDGAAVRGLVLLERTQGYHGVSLAHVCTECG